MEISQVHDTTVAGASFLRKTRTCVPRLNSVGHTWLLGLKESGHRVVATYLSPLQSGKRQLVLLKQQVVSDNDGYSRRITVRVMLKTIIILSVSPVYAPLYIVYRFS